MTDHVIPTNLTHGEARAVREWAERARDAEDQDETVAHAARVLLAVLPKPTTLEDMGVEEREECRWMQANVEGVSTRYVIADPRDDDNGTAMLISEEGQLEWVFPEYVVPRPDLPRMPWADTEKAAPALPGEWRLAEHRKYGRVIVTALPTDSDDRAYFVHPDFEDDRGFDWNYCSPDELTIDTEPEADTSDAVPPNTLSAGSEWDDEEALSRACKESGRDHITVTSCDGRVSVWDEGKVGWRVCYPLSKYGPFTVLHEGTSVLWADR